MADQAPFIINDNNDDPKNKDLAAVPPFNKSTDNGTSTAKLNPAPFILENATCKLGLKYGILALVFYKFHGSGVE